MDLQLTIRLEEPLLVGDRRTDGTINESLDYVPGSVLRAAFARAILAECPCHDPSTVEPTGRYFWVEYHAEAACANCRWREWCRQFDRIAFGQATPAGGQPLPLTAMGCKAHPDHPTVDTLLNRIVRQCLAQVGRDGTYRADTPFVCASCGGRMDGRGGFRIATAGSPDQSVAVARRLLTRVGIDDARKTAQDSVLYSLRPISEVTPGANGYQPTVLSAHISFPGDDPAPDVPVTDLWLGARTSRGLGRTSVTATACAPVTPIAYGGDAAPLESRLSRFSACLDALWHAQLAELGLPDRSLPEPGLTLIPLLFISDVDLGPVEEITLVAPSEADQSALLTHWGAWIARALADVAAATDVSAPPVTVEHGVMQYRTWRGWSWVNGAQHPEAVHLRARMGSVLVLGVRDAGADLMPLLAAVERRGLGQRTNEGFGRVVVAHPFHCDGRYTGDDGETH